MYFETIREQPAPPPIKGVKIELSLSEMRDLEGILFYMKHAGPRYSKNSSISKLMDHLIESIKGCY